MERPSWIRNDSGYFSSCIFWDRKYNRFIVFFIQPTPFNRTQRVEIDFSSVIQDRYGSEIADVYRGGVIGETRESDLDSGHVESRLLAKIAVCSGSVEVAVINEAGIHTGHIILVLQRQRIKRTIRDQCFSALTCVHAQGVRSLHQSFRFFSRRTVGWRLEPVVVEGVIETFIIPISISGVSIASRHDTIRIMANAVSGSINHTSSIFVKDPTPLGSCPAGYFRIVFSYLGCEFTVRLSVGSHCGHLILMAASLKILLRGRQNLKCRDMFSAPIRVLLIVAPCQLSRLRIIVITFKVDRIFFHANYLESFWQNIREFNLRRKMIPEVSAISLVGVGFYNPPKRVARPRRSSYCLLRNFKAFLGDSGRGHSRAVQAFFMVLRL
ncbi:hypothetical protein M3B90_04880 [Dermabacter sp. p3-SID358]|uniref:hypothetical protein n=1 Tax=Dermabacter sp. p3-SID358 TaxID=2916114 RepID=UPI0021A67B00|nr:hypothetical protein [Dermabacter sp. p3-SID358]MCT1866856.1 hypothetical protein [Dermabacter sp. p3-SID358]